MAAVWMLWMWSASSELDSISSLNQEQRATERLFICFSVAFTRVIVLFAWTQRSFCTLKETNSRLCNKSVCFQSINQIKSKTEIKIWLKLLCLKIYRLWSFCPDTLNINQQKRQIQRQKKRRHQFLQPQPSEALEAPEVIYYETAWSIMLLSRRSRIMSTPETLHQNKTPSNWN